MPTTTSTEPYELIYWPGFPGRAEHIRLALEEAGASYTDTAQTGNPDPVLALVDPSRAPPGDDLCPPIFAPPALRHGDLLLSQLPNILLYLAPRLGLAPEGDGLYVVNALALTALDGLSNEVHDVHHPIAIRFVAFTFLYSLPMVLHTPVMRAIRRTHSRASLQTQA